MFPARVSKSRPFLINASGFTLGQLLAALVIINIVAFFLYLFLAVLQQANSYARSSYCTGNFKQVSVAFRQYAADYDERFPPCATAIKNNNALLGWAATHDRYGGPISPDTTAPQTSFNPLIGGYLKTESILRCPEVPNSSGRVSYMFNDLAAGVTQKDFAAIAHTVLICDGENVAGNVGHAYNPSLPPSPASFFRDGTVVAGATLQFAPTRHNGRATYCFADGHIRLSKPGVIYFPPRRFDSPSHIDKQNGKTTGPDPAKLDAAGYIGTFHVN